MKNDNNLDPSKRNITGVYKVTNKESGVVYLGSSANIHQRWNNLKKMFRQPEKYRYDFSQNLYDDVKQYGYDAFEFEVLHDCKGDEGLAESMERLEILSRPKEACHNVHREGAWKKRSEKLKKGKWCCPCGEEIDPKHQRCNTCNREYEQENKDKVHVWHKTSYKKMMCDPARHKIHNARKNREAIARYWDESNPGYREKAKKSSATYREYLKEHHPERMKAWADKSYAKHVARLAIDPEYKREMYDKENKRRRDERAAATEARFPPTKYMILSAALPLLGITKDQTYKLVKDGKLTVEARSKKGHRYILKTEIIRFNQDKQD